MFQLLYYKIFFIFLSGIAGLFSGLLVFYRTKREGVAMVFGLVVGTIVGAVMLCRMGM